MSDTDIEAILLRLGEETDGIDEITSNVVAFLQNLGADDLPAVLLFTSETFAARREEIENPDPAFFTITEQQDAMLAGLRPYLQRHGTGVSEIAINHGIAIDELQEEWPEIFNSPDYVRGYRKGLADSLGKHLF